MDTEKLLASLNEEQKQAVLLTEGYVRVIAGAGSGKTRALTARYAYLVQELGISPSNILCITFTNKAAREMKKRLRYFLGDGIDTSFVSTLHAFCTRVLREDIGRLFYPENFVVLDNSDQKSILEEIYEELNIKMDTATFEFMIDKIRYEKNLITYLDYLAVPGNEISGAVPKDLEQKIIYRYMEKQKKYFGLDFFDLINFTIYLFRNHTDILEKWQNRMNYIMVDEFQDITMKEFKLIRHLTEKHQNFFAVGDPDQNIYEWRGSKMEVLLNFEENLRKYFADGADSYIPQQQKNELKAEFYTVLLNQNYRSSPEILNASNSLISKNQNRIEKNLFTDNPSGIMPEHFHGKNDKEEIRYIAEKINAHVKDGGKYSDIAVLYRSAYVSRFIEQGFLKANIPYVVFGGFGFYERREIKDVLSYMRLVCYGDDLSFLRISNIPRRRLGKNKTAILKEYAAKSKTTLYEALKENAHSPSFANTGAKKFIEVIESAKEASDSLQVSELLQKLLIDSGYEQYIRESGEMDRLDNVSELLRSIAQLEADYGEPLTLSVFLQDISLHRDTEEDENKDNVKIMTAHTSKGLEFNTVIVAGMSEKTFPSARALEERREEALEEERRLAYVAMTRAKQKLFITESEGYGFKGYSRTPSRFLFDIADENIKRIGEIGADIMAEYALQTVMRRNCAENYFEKGTNVKHKVFGEGVIEDADEVTKTYTIRFLVGVKQIRFDYQGLSQVF
ncbi:MAG: ATP-dependent helicase [Clostridiales bacterium]|jgi:DNA helicase-2/ATP-dependent DNA helicase PcrA|nr:ATP-dependent helicase [Clostridiales bacterium]